MHIVTTIHTRWGDLEISTISENLPLVKYPETALFAKAYARGSEVVAYHPKGTDMELTQAHFETVVRVIENLEEWALPLFRNDPYHSYH